MYQPKIYKDTNGDRQVVASGGTLLAQSGAAVDLSAATVTLPETQIRYAEITVTNAEMLALRATPKTLVAAAGAGKTLEFISAILIFDYTGAYTESADNLVVRYATTTGAKASSDIESTGFVDATADTLTTTVAIKDAIVAKTVADNTPLVLHNIGDGELGGGNAANLIRVKVAYRVHTNGW